MSSGTTVEDISVSLKELNTGMECQCYFYKNCVLGVLESQLESNPASQETLDECLLIGLRSIPTQSQHHVHGLAAVELLLKLGAKWDGSTLFQMDRTPYHIIMQCSSDHHRLLNSMINCFGGKSLNVQDSSGCTAVMYAVHNRNIECLRCLIAHGADLNLGSDMTTPLIDAIRTHASSPAPITRDILNLLLESGVDVNQPCQIGRSPIEYAMDNNSLYCVKKLVQNGAQLDLIPLWFLAASKKNIEMLGYLLDRGTDINCTDSAGRNVLCHAVCIGDIKLTQYLLEAGVTITTSVKQQYDLRPWSEYFSYTYFQQNVAQLDPCMQAVSWEMLDVVQLLGNYEQRPFQSIEALRCAVLKNSFKMANYLLSKYEYPLNIEYPLNNGFNSFKAYHTIVTEAGKRRQLEMVSLLMEHGAEPAKQSDHKQYQSAFLIAIENGCIELVAHFIRSGVNLDCRLHNEYHGAVLPFEYAVIKDKKQTAEMLLHGGSSCGMFTLVDNISTDISYPQRCHMFQRYVSPELQKLMREWDVHENNVQPLQLLCRKSILKQLCPRTIKKITELPLPARIIRYLSFRNFDDIIDEC